MPDTLAHERILVTGGSGFFGQHLLRALVESGCRPAATTRSRTHLHVAPDLLQTVDWAEIGWDEPASLDDLWKRTRPTLLFHLAGVRIADGDRDAEVLNRQGNVTPLQGLLAAAGTGDLRRLVALGSAEEYGGQPGPWNESLEPKPVTSYGRAKAEATRLLLDRYQSHGLPAVVLRPFSVYGPSQPGRMFVAQAVAHAVANRPFAMTEGRQKRDLIFIADLVRALLTAATAPGIDGQVVNLGSGEPQALREVAELIWRISGTEAPLLIGARSAPPAELHDTYADISRARRSLNWEPRVDLESGLRATIDSARAN